jgi:hypothetical protein
MVGGLKEEKQDEGIRSGKGDGLTDGKVEGGGRGRVMLEEGSVRVKTVGRDETGYSGGGIDALKETERGGRGEGT